MKLYKVSLTDYDVFFYTCAESFSDCEEKSNKRLEDSRGEIKSIELIQNEI